MARSQEFS